MNDLAVTLDEYVVPDGWVIAPLADLAINPKNDIVDGPFGSNLKASEYTESGVPILRLQNIKRNYFLDKNIKFVTQEKYEQLIRHTYKTGDILITKLGDPLGVACIAPQSMGEGVIVADLVRARLPVDQINTKYITYLINSPLAIKQFKENTKGTTRQRVNLKFVRDLRLPIAPLEQQKRIVAKIEELFSHIDASIEALNKAKQLLKQYRQSVLKAAVTGELTKEWREQNKDKLEPASQLLERILKERRQKWEEKQLEQFKAKGKIPKDDKWKEKYKLAGEPIIESSEGVPKEWCIVRLDAVSEIIDSLHQTPKYSEEGYPMARVTEIKGGGLDLTNAYRVNEEVFRKFTKRYQPKQGDILISRVGTYGNASIVVTDEDFCLGQNTAVICPSINSNYLHRVLESKYAKNQIDRLVVGSTQKTLSLKNMAGLSVTIPSNSEQEVIVEVIGEKIDSIVRLEDEIDSQLLKAEKNKQSILVSAFSGSLVEALNSDGSAKELIESIEDVRMKTVNEKPVRKKSQKKSREEFVKKLIVDVLKEKGELTVSSLMQESGYKPDEIENFYDDLSGAADSIVELRPKGSKAKSWPYDDEVKLKLK